MCLGSALARLTSIFIPGPRLEEGTLPITNQGVASALHCRDIAGINCKVSGMVIAPTVFMRHSMLAHSRISAYSCSNLRAPSDPYITFSSFYTTSYRLILVRYRYTLSLGSVTTLVGIRPGSWSRQPYLPTPLLSVLGRPVDQQHIGISKPGVRGGFKVAHVPVLVYSIAHHMLNTI